ncbi:hypothetical protein IT570_06380 [Candidatus Sumerlaeota bacterium]|nr:hypothetical protein [Candidatus Sumerlaeota bacterium]
MATEGKVPPGDSDPIARRIEDLSRKVDEVRSAAASAKAAGHIMTLLIAVAAVVGVVTLVSPFWGLKEKKHQDELVAALVAEYNATIKADLMKELEESQANTGPVVREILTKKWHERSPEVVDAFSKESSIFTDNVKKLGEKMWQTHIANLDSQIYNRLEKSVPDLADADKTEVVLNNAHEAVNSAVERLISEYLKEHVDSINSIQEQITAFPIPSHIKDKSDDELRDAFSDILITYSTNTLKAGLNPQSRAFLSDLGNSPEDAAASDSEAAEKGN